MINKKKIVAIIPARAGSKGLKNKNIKIINKKPLIYWSINSLKKSKYIDKIIVSTDSKKIKDIAQSFGADTPFLRPKKISTDKAKSFDVIKHCLKFLKKQNENFDYIILLEPTSPLTTSFDIDNALRTLDKNKNADSLVSIAENINCHPTFNINLNNKGIIKPYLKKLDGPRRQDLSKLFFYCGNVYISKIKTLLKSKSFYQKDKTIGFKSNKWQSLEIDDIYDFIFVESVMKYKKYK